MPLKEEKTKVINKGLNNHIESEINGNTLTSNIQNGDQNEEIVENVNVDKTLQEEKMNFELIHIHDGKVKTKLVVIF